ncbi:TPA: relaxase/mobilization nuclease domain-containing protein [Raoultella ornithinolytica]
MHIKFMAHGTGSGAAASAYLMGDLDHKGVARAGVEVLRGDPVLFGALADSLPFQQRYTSAVISWATEEAPTEDEINAVLDDFEKLAFAGLDRQDVHLTAVLHREEDGGVHVHILIPRVHLGTGKSLNVAPPGQRSHFDSLRNKWNYGKGWARPDDPLRRRPVQPSFDVYRDANDRKAIKKQVSEYLLGFIAQGVITNAADLRRKVVEMGCEITRSGADHLSIKPEGYPKAIRLKGEIYGASWTVENTLEREDRAAEARRTGRGNRRIRKKSYAKLTVFS